MDVENSRTDMTTGVPEYVKREENGLGTWDVAVLYKFITSFRLVKYSYVSRS